MYRKFLKRIMLYTKKYRVYLILSLLSYVVGIGLTLVAPVLVGKSIDLILGEGQVDFLGIYKILITLSVMIIVGSFFQWIAYVCTNKLTYKTVRDIRSDIFEKINRVPLKYIDSIPHGDLISRIINDVDAISDGLLQTLMQLFSGVITIIGTFAFMIYVNPIITAVVVVLTPLSIFIAMFISKKSFIFFKNQSDMQGKMTAFISEMFSSQKIIKSFSYEDESFNKFKKMNSELYSVGVKSQFYSSLANPGTRFVNSIIYTAVGIIGSYMAVVNGSMTIGAIASFLSYANQYTKPFNEITGVVTQIQSAFAGAKRVFEVLDEYEEKDIEGALEINDVKGHVTLENVSFAYNPSIKIIDNLSLNVEPGKKVAITGPTGSGKTTIINLLMRFYDVDEGVTDEEIILAAKRANAHNFIKRMEKGYDTVISENASNISIGQKQLLCIARVMLLDPPMQILDEATSNIDTMTEQKIQMAFNEMMKGRTSFIVAHRLSTIKNADIRVEISRNK